MKMPQWAGSEQPEMLNAGDHWHSGPVYSSVQSHELASQEPAARAAVMFVGVPRPLQLQSVWQNSPKKLPLQAQEPASHEPAARAPKMFVCVPRLLQSHSSSWQ